MAANRDAEIQRICEEALARPALDRQRFVVEACGGDDGLRREVQTLLAHDDSAADFLALPAFEMEAQLIAVDVADARQTVVGTWLGGYKILSLIGSGGMGTVYRARDSKLGRDVAVKILPPEFAADGDRLARFRREAHLLASLNHPSIAAIYGLDEANGMQFLVLELVDGETLATRLAKRRLPISDALAIAVQITDALEAAHDKGIIHRDLKPANIALTPAGKVKVLDFGLAKPTDASLATLTSSVRDVATRLPTAVSSIGAIVGTAPYMSPEQARGAAVDKRVDVWAFGCVLYEMLTGRRAFDGDTLTDVIASVIHKSPAWDALPPGTPAGVRRVLQRSLTKEPALRLRDIADARFDLNETTDPIAHVSTPHGWLVIAGLGVTGIALFTGGLTLGRLDAVTAPPSYHLVTSTGKVMRARFAPDGETLVYSAASDGQPLQIFSMRTESAESRAVGLERSDVLAVSSRGEMAILLHRRDLGSRSTRGMLARAPLIGGAPRDVLDDVQEADWSPDGSQLAVIRWVNGRDRVEYPIGHVLYETSGYLSDARVSPDGRLVAFMDHGLKNDNRGSVAVVDLDAHQRRLTDEWYGENGLVWSHDGREVWFTAAKADDFDTLRGVTLNGRQRVIARAPGHLMIQDMSRDGRALITRDDSRTTVVGLAPGSSSERDLSSFNDFALRDLSAEGSTILFTNFLAGASRNYATYVRKTAGSPAVRLGEGDGCALSPDGKWVVALLKSPSKLFLLPTGAGDVRPLDVAGIEVFDKPARWVAEPMRILFAGKQAGHDWRSYVVDVAGGPARPVTPEGVIGYFVSPDGTSIIAQDPSRRKFLYSINAADAAPRSLRIAETDGLSGWSADGRSVFVSRLQEGRIKILRFNLATQTEELIRETTPHDGAAAEGMLQVLVASDGKSYAYQIADQLADLYLVRGLR